MDMKQNYSLKYYIDKYNINDLFETDITNYMKLYKFEKNEYLLETNKNPTNLYFLVKGSLKCYTILKNGKILLHEIIRPLTCVGDVELIHGSIPHCSIQTLGYCECIGINLKILSNLIKNDLRFHKYLAKSLSTKLVRYTQTSSINLIYPLENKLASYLIALQEGNIDKEYIKIDSMTELASLFATSYRHLARTINNLCSENIIKKDRNKICILNFNELKKLADSIE